MTNKRVHRLSDPYSILLLSLYFYNFYNDLNLQFTLTMKHVLIMKFVVKLNYSVDDKNKSMK